VFCYWNFTDCVVIFFIFIHVPALYVAKPQYLSDDMLAVIVITLTGIKMEGKSRTSIAHPQLIGIGLDCCMNGQEYVLCSDSSTI